MRQSVRAKLLVMLSVLALGFGVLMGVSSLVERKVARDLALIQERFIPMIALGPQLEQAFERLRRGFSDAVGAQDGDALEETVLLRDALREALEKGQGALHPEHERALTRGVDDYYGLAYDVSRRLLLGESGEALRADLLAMQSRHTRVLELLRQATAFDHHALAQAFAEASSAQETSTRVRLVVSLGCLSVVLVLTVLISRGFLRALGELGAGFERFGRAEFKPLIREHGDLELRQLARQANQMAESLERTSAERDRQQKELRQMNTELAEVSSYKSQFLANMSHELRTPLNSMLVLSGLLADNEARNLTARQVEYCRTIHDAGTDLLALINQVLDLAKIESGKQDVHVSEVSLAELASYARRIFEPLARDRQLRFTIELAAQLPVLIRSDRRRIEQVLNNLLGNAIKFTEHGGVLLRFSLPAADTRFQRSELRSDQTLAIEIEDTGAGIPSEHQGRIFAAFEQLEGSSDRRYGGTGLGLSIARDLATLLGGEIQLRSVPGQGSTFTCYLPFAIAAETGLELAKGASLAPPAPEACAPNEPSAAAVTTRAAPMAELPSDLLQGKTIVVADDDMRSLYALAALLHAKGAEVLTTDTGQGALLVLAQHPDVSVVLLDMNMPEMDGAEALQRIREQPRFAALPVVVMTGKARQEQVEASLPRGASACLPKPIDGDSLCLLLHSLLRARPSLLDLHG